MMEFLFRHQHQKHRTIILLSVPAVGAELAGGDADGLHQVIQPVVTKGGESQALADFLNHLFVNLALSGSV